jgi:orotidine-5'-phosphate decarboxylase
MKIVDKYHERVQVTRSLLCVGLDSSYERLPMRFKREQYPQFTFNRWIIEQTHTVASAYKPNIAFYEARGADGWRELQMTMDYLREHHPEILTICDAKRADIGSTNIGYVTAIFDQLGFDAITLHPYLGQEALQPFLDRADRACIILCVTSNPGAGEFQGMRVDKHRPLWQYVLMNVQDHWNVNGNCMVVMGATTPELLAEARELAPNLVFLVPGVGAQGGDPAAVMRAGRMSNGAGLIVNASRSIIFADDPGAAARSLATQLRV